MTLQRKLPSVTIIPERLYVERAADRQLKEAILSRGRPPYVLVARQMGKTNLLLHAKRALESNEDVFLYFDFSVRFATLQSAFRHIIDTAVEARSYLASVAAEVASIRAQNREPQREYELCMRLLAASIPGSLTLIFDEVDALTGLPYSNQMFAQIRSTYFSRINYSELNKITYVLSGVAEPTDLIKDKTISPFNIGEKIYLADFSEEEVRLFVEKSGLDFPPAVVDQVYFWARGNPRMTWDICASLEIYVEEKSRRQSNTKLQSEDVNSVVDTLYLRNYNRAPVDHIRTLVEADPTLQSAIVQMRSGYGATLSSAVTSRLYLSGIANLDVDVRSAQIKNPIIDAALSNQWLEEVSERPRELLPTAVAHLMAGRYSRAITDLKTFLDRETISEADADIAHYHLGNAYFLVGSFDDAVRQFRQVLRRSENSAHAPHSKLLLALSLYRSSRFQEAIGLLAELQSTLQHGRHWLRATSALVAAYVEESPKRHKQQITKAADEVFAYMATGKPADFEEAVELLASTHLNLAMAYLEWGEQVQAAKELETARTISESPVLSVKILFQLHRLAGKNQKQGVAVDLATAICKLPRVDASVSESIGTSLSDEILLESLIAVWESARDQFDPAVEHVRYNVFKDRSTPLELGIQIFEQAAFGASAKQALEMLEYVFTSNDGVETNSVRLDALRALVTTSYANTKLISQYVDAVEKAIEEETFTLTGHDLFAALTSVPQLTTVGQVRRGYALVRSFRAYEARYSGSARDLALLDVAEIQALEVLGRSQEVQRTAALLLARTSTVEDGKLQAVPGQLLAQLRKYAESIIRKPELSTATYDKYGRNQRVKVRYETGVVVERKFKYVKEDLENSLCKIVDS